MGCEGGGRWLDGPAQGGVNEEREPTPEKVEVPEPFWVDVAKREALLVCGNSAIAPWGYCSGGVRVSHPVVSCRATGADRAPAPGGTEPYNTGGDSQGVCGWGVSEALACTLYACARARACVPWSCVELVALLWPLGFFLSIKVDKKPVATLATTPGSVDQRIALG